MRPTDIQPVVQPVQTRGTRPRCQPRIVVVIRRQRVATSRRRCICRTGIPGRKRDVYRRSTHKILPSHLCQPTTSVPLIFSVRKTDPVNHRCAQRVIPRNRVENSDIVWGQFHQCLTAPKRGGKKRSGRGKNPVASKVRPELNEAVVQEGKHPGESEEQRKACSTNE